MTLYLLLINAAAFGFMLADKRFARKKMWRIPESVLLLTALCGGSVGGILGMYLCSHKTLHPRFSIGLPMILLVQVVAYALWAGRT